jgi:Flp pilus assembly protein TadG
MPHPDRQGSMSECSKHAAGRKRIVTDRRAAISLIVAASLPVLIGVMAFGIDISYWTAVRIELQRTADIAALAGAAKYASTYSSSKALTTAANIAELNGLPVGSRTGDGITTLTDQYGAYTATFAFTTSPAQITATVHHSLQYTFAAILASGSSQTETISATAVAQTFPRNSNESCVLALSGYSTGITTSTDLTISGGKGTNVSMSGCDLRSDASIAFNGSPGVAVPNLVASGGISGSYNNTCTSSTSCDQQFVGVPQVPDPFASTYNLSVPASAVAQPQGTTLSPPPAGEAYQSLAFGSATYTLNPGIYYVSGSVTFDSNSAVSGTGVTIIMGSGGSLTMNGSTTVNLTAPSTGSTAGLLFGSTTSNSITFNGNASLTLAGALYTPNSSVTISGNTSSTGSCLSLVALNVAFAGSSSFASSGCAALGVPPIYDYPATARLVE